MSLSASSSNPFNSEIAKACDYIKKKQRYAEKISLKELADAANINYSNLSTIISESNFYNDTYIKKASEEIVIKILVTLHMSKEESLIIARSMGYDFSDERLKKNQLVLDAITSPSTGNINDILRKLQISSIEYVLNK